MSCLIVASSETWEIESVIPVDKPELTWRGGWPVDLRAWRVGVGKS
jgi:hypothetical protein